MPSTELVLGASLGLAGRRKTPRSQASPKGPLDIQILPVADVKNRLRRQRECAGCDTIDGLCR